MNVDAVMAFVPEMNENKIFKKYLFFMPNIWYSRIYLVLLQRKDGTGSDRSPLFLFIKEC
jgi:hypothetical protein